MDPAQQSIVWEALEASAVPTERHANASRYAVLGLRDTLLRFLDELNGGLSIADVREALEDYR
ncbi:hypothetical protein ACQR1I_35945 [Bradyrhizobium sp. HKCCYLS2038]|uniref:hypothetical protein n=1 Tax=Bradyrhizobium sp. HKCCYLS2038 TaxID=3420764 RepID=UPI003EBE35AE